MIINLIRHGKTPGNEEKRYIGRTDEALSESGMQEIKQISYPTCEAVVMSPMKRCIQTAELIYPNEKYPEKKRICVEGFREIDFGLFEGKNYKELSGNAQYQAWIDSNGTMDFPEGEGLLSFKKRVIKAFEEVLAELGTLQEISLVVHGGTIMTLLEHYEGRHGYYDWQCVNGCGYRVEYKNETMTVIAALERQ